MSLNLAAGPGARELRRRLRGIAPATNAPPAFLTTVFTAVMDALAGLRATALAAGLERSGPVGGIYDDELFTQDAGQARVYLPVIDSPALDGIGALCWPLAPAGAEAN